MGTKRKTCKVCNSKQLAQIDGKIRNGDSLSSLSKRYGLSRSTLRKHRDECIPALLAQDKTLKEVSTGEMMVKQVGAQIKLVAKLIAACDDYLTDPDDPDKYFLGPRGEEIEIVYQEVDKENGKVDNVQRKATLQEILDAIENKGYVIRGITNKHSDPRDLLLKAIGKLEGTAKMIIAATEQLIEWEYKKASLEKLSGSELNSVSFEKQVDMITERVTISLKDTNSEVLCKKAGLPEIKKGG